MKQSEMPDAGTTVTVKIKGQPVAATYHSWSEKYSMPLVKVDGKVIPRVFSLGVETAVTPPPTPASDEVLTGRTFSVERYGVMHCYVNGELRSKFKTKEITIHATAEI